MKRCPQCNFIYLDTDETCDLDGTKLVAVAETEIEDSSTEASERSSGTNMPRAVTHHRSPAVIGLVLAVTIALALVVGYYGATRRSERRQQPQLQSSPSPFVAEQAISTPTPIESVPVSPTPALRPSPFPRTTPERGTISSSPVSTTNDQKTKGPMVIRLSSGATVEADEVWRTKEGVWYRRSGMVTLLKSSQVRSIERKRGGQ